MATIILYFFLAAIVLFVLAHFASPPASKTDLYLPTDPSGFYLQPPDWKGTPVDRRGRFINHEFPYRQYYPQVLAWLPAHIWWKLKRVRHRLPVKEIESKDFLAANNILIWLGHASFYMSIGGKRMLIDPHFYGMPFYRRYSRLPIAPEQFKGIDYILLSHDHQDHFCIRSLRLLISQNPGVKVLAGIGMDKLIRREVQPDAAVITADWYQRFVLPEGPEIFFVPARHYAKRVFRPFNGWLWGGFVIRSPMPSGETVTLYYGGDSGYGSHFSQVGTLFQPEIAILGIGAYRPTWFMHPNHTSPEEARDAFVAMGASTLIPMHFGTFRLANEGLLEPLTNLQALVPADQLRCLTPGELMPIADAGTRPVLPADTGKEPPEA